MATGQARNLAVEHFELDERADASTRRADLRLVGDRVTPMALAREQTMPVLGPLVSLFPEGALRRGSVVGVRGSGATALALAVAAGPSASGAWTAVVGDPDLGLAAVGELGVALERLLVVRPEPDTWSSALAALIGSVDVVVVAPRHRVREADARRMAARLRERGSVLIHVGDRWPVGADVQLDVAAGEWAGLGDGHGVLTARRLRIEGGGRGSASRPRSLEVLVPGPGGAIAELAPPAAEPLARDA
ncbi:MAG: hypothetical protein AAGC53_14380 [Actinomycetota bacterium]